MGMAAVVDSKEIKRFALLPISSSKQWIEGWNREISITGKTHLKANFSSGGAITAPHLNQVVKAHQRFARTLVKAPLNLQVIKTLGLQGCSHQWQCQGLNPQALNPLVVFVENLVIKPLAREPLGERTSLGSFRQILLG